MVTLPTAATRKREDPKWRCRSLRPALKSASYDLLQLSCKMQQLDLLQRITSTFPSKPESSLAMTASLKETAVQCAPRCSG